MPDLEKYDFRHVHPCLRFGTTSDRYAGWIGQIYPENTYKINSRSRKLGGKSYREETVPVTSVADYFEHFGCLEIDFTFYRTLLNREGEPTNNYFVLRRYAEHSPDSARFFLKAPQAYAARRIRTTQSYEENDSYLHFDGFIERFLKPCRDILGNRLAGVIFEQEYQRKSDSPSNEENIATLDSFFRQLPDSPQMHLELRSPHLITPEYVAWLKDRGLGFVYSHWTWLPPLKRQWERVEGFPATDGQGVVRLLTPLRMPYARAYAHAHPFDKPAPELVDHASANRMIDDSNALIFKAIEAGQVLNILVNNRAWGNAPALTAEIARRFFDVAERKGLL